jgi:hypothetical protein
MLREHDSTINTNSRQWLIIISICISGVLGLLVMSEDVSHFVEYGLVFLLYAFLGWSRTGTWVGAYPLTFSLTR